MFRAEYGFDTKFAKKHNQEPHFSITGEGKSVNSRGGDGYFGTCHDKIVELLPKLKPLVRWHLCGMETGPMHYIENALYHAGFWMDTYGDSRNIEHLKSTIVYGALERDDCLDDGSALEEELATMNPIEFRAWLENRFELLMKQFESDIKQHAPGLWTGTEKEMGRVYARGKSS